MMTTPNHEPISNTPRFEFHDADQPLAATDIRDLGTLIGNAALQSIETSDERSRYLANERSWNASEEGLQEWIEKARSLPLSILLTELAIVVTDEAYRRGAKPNVLSDNHRFDNDHA